MRFCANLSIKGENYVLSQNSIHLITASNSRLMAATSDLDTFLRSESRIEHTSLKKITVYSIQSALTFHLIPIQKIRFLRLRSFVVNRT